MKLRNVSALFAGLLLTAFAHAEEGFYVGAGVGLTQIEDDEAGLSFDDSAIGWRVLAGYQFTDHFAIEGGYFDSGEAEDSILGFDVDIELTGFTVFGVGIIPLNDAWELFGKAGYYDGEAEASVLGVSVDDDESGLVLGVGARYNFGNNVAVRGDFDWFDTEADRIWSVGIGIEYTFR